MKLKLNPLTPYGLYAAETYYHNKEFTPEEVVECFVQTCKQSFADTSRRKKLEEKSQNTLQDIITNYKFSMNQPLTAKTSIGAEALAHLALAHCDMCHMLSENTELFDELINYPLAFEY